MAVDLGTAYISLVPTTKDLDKGIKSALDGSVKHADKAGADMGSRLATGLVAHVGKAGVSSGDAFGKGFSPRVQSAGKNALAGLANLMVGSAQGIGGEVGGKISSGLTLALSKGAGEAINTLDAIGTKGGAAMSSKLTSAGIIAAGGVALIGTAAIAATNKLYEIGAAWDDVTDSITASTGAIGQRLDAITDSVKNVAVQTAAAPGDIAAVTAQLVQTLKLSGSDLENLTKQVSDYNEMNKGAPLNVREFAKAMKQYGITSATEMSNILDRLNNVAQNTGMPLNGLISSLRSAGPVAQQFKLPLADVTQLLATFEDAGLNAESAATLLKLALGNLAKADPSADPVTGLQAVITKIQELDKSGRTLEAIDLAKSTFGRSWDQILPLIQENKLEIDNLNTSTASLGPTINEQRKATQDFTEEWRKFKNFLEIELLPVATSVFGGINDILSGLTTNIRSYIDILRGGTGKVNTSGFGDVPTGSTSGQFGGANAQRERRGAAPIPGFSIGGAGSGFGGVAGSPGKGYPLPFDMGGAGFSIGGAGAPMRSVGSNANLAPNTVSLKDRIATAFPIISDIGGYRPKDKYPDHPSGKAIDVMIPPNLRGTPEGMALGNQIAQMALADPNTKYVMWNQSQITPGSGVSPMKDRGSATENHMDHVHILTYDEGGYLPPGVGMVANNTGKPELVLTPEQQQQLIDQGIDPNSLVNGSQPQVDAGQQPMDPQQPADLQSSNRSEGFIPVAASNTGVAGTSSLSALFDLGNQAVGSAIDMGAQVAGMAASAAAAGAGAPGGGAAANVGIQIGASIAKRGAKLGFDLLGIGTDALIAQLFPFGAPRWIGYDYTNFAPQMSVMTPAAVTTGEKAINASLQQGGGPRAAESGPGANQNIFGGPTGTPPGPQPPVTELATPPAAQPGGPVSPETMSGVQQPITQDNAAQPWWQNLAGTYDQGGMLPPGGIGINMTNRPEPVLTPQQWDAMTTNISSGGRDAPLVKIDAIYGMSPEDVATKIESKQRLAMMRYAGRP